MLTGGTPAAKQACLIVCFNQATNQPSHFLKAGTIKFKKECDVTIMDTKNSDWLCFPMQTFMRHDYISTKNNTSITAEGSSGTAVCVWPLPAIPPQTLAFSTISSEVHFVVLLLSDSISVETTGNKRQSLWKNSLEFLGVFFSNWLLDTNAKKQHVLYGKPKEGTAKRVGVSCRCVRYIWCKGVSSLIVSFWSVSYRIRQ